MASHQNMRTLVTALGLFALLLSTGSLAGSLKDDGANEPKERGEWISGIDYKRDAQSYFSGITVAFNGDQNKDGFALRVMGIRDNFDLDPGSGRSWQGDVMLGYLFNRKNLDAAIFVGLDYQDVQLRPDDPTARVRGTETGFKVTGWIETDRDLPHYFDLHGEYSTAFDSYWVRARLGLTRNKVAFGPEFSVEGDEDSRQHRIGAFVIFDVKLPPRTVEVTLSAGHQFSDDSTGTGTGTSRGGGDGNYATFRLIAPF